MCSGVGLKPLSVNSDSYLTKKKERIKSQMKAKNCLLYLLQLCRLEFLLETLEVNLTLLFKVTFYYSQPFHKLPHSWELEAQAGDNCDGQRTIGPEKKSISLFHWRSDIRMTFVGKKETWISTSISDQTGTFAWIEFPSKVRIWFYSASRNQLCYFWF